MIDPRTTSPLDDRLDPGERRGDRPPGRGRRVATRAANLATDIAALAAENAFDVPQGADSSKVTPPHTPVPFAPELEDAYIPTAADIQAAVKEVAA